MTKSRNEPSRLAKACADAVAAMENFKATLEAVTGPDVDAGVEFTKRKVTSVNGSYDRN